MAELFTPRGTREMSMRLPRVSSTLCDNLPVRLFPLTMPTSPKRPAPSWCVYILRCADGTLYTGIAVDVEARLKQHERGRGARYTRGRGPLALVHVEAAASHGDALRREAAIRRSGRAGKEALVAGSASAN